MISHLVENPSAGQVTHKFTLTRKELAQAIADYLVKTKELAACQAVEMVEQVNDPEVFHFGVHLLHALDPKGHVDEHVALMQKFGDDGVATFEWTAQKPLVWWQLTWETTPGAVGMSIMYMRVRGRNWEVGPEPHHMNGQWDPGARPVRVTKGDKIEIGFKGKPGEAVRAAMHLRWLAD